MRFKKLRLAEGFAEEVVHVPGGALAGLGNVVADEKIDLHELDGGVEVESLGHVVGGGVIVEADVVVGEFLAVHFRIFGVEAFTE